MAKAKKTPKTDILEDAKKAFAEYEEHWSDFYDEAEDAFAFRAGDQWPAQIKKDRETDPNGARPCLTMDRTNQYVRQVVNDGRQNKPAIKVRPVDSGADIKTAEMLQGLTRQIEDTSRAEIAYDTALDSGATCGLGWWRIVPEVVDKKSNRQDIKIKRIPNIRSVVSDKYWTEPDGSDMTECFITEKIPRKKFEREYPKADVKSWEADKDNAEWVDKDFVRIAEWFKVEDSTKNVFIMEDGTEIDEDQYFKAYEGEEVPPQPVEVREEQTHIVHWRKITCAEVLEESIYPASYIGIIPCIGNEIWVDGKRKLTGMVKLGMDAQRMYNYANSAFVEFVALAPKAPFIAAVGQTEDLPGWDEANTRNIPVLTYNPIDANGQPAPPPQRQMPPAVPQGWMAIMQNMDQNMQAAFGMYNASLGAPSNEKSGKAILARQREGDIATFHYIDNLSRSIAHSGRIILEMIRKLYDTRRVQRILGEDGTTDIITIDPNQSMPSKEIQTDNGIKKIFNPMVGTYDVTVSTGPAYSTRREEAAQAMMEMAQANPAVWQTHGDLMVQAQDWPMADKFAERFKAMLPPNIQGLDDADDPKVEAVKAQLTQQMEAMQQGAQQAVQERDQALQQAGEQLQDMQQQLAELRLQAKGKDGEISVKEQEAEIEWYKAETDRYKVQQESGINAIQSLLTEHEARMKEMMAACQSQQVEGEEEPEQDGQIQAMIQQSHEATMMAVAEIVQAMQQQTAALSQPRSKQMQITAPSGQVYTGVVQEA